MPAPDRPPPAPPRLFLALWPDDATRDALAAHQAAWRWPAGSRTVAPAQLHLTLHFIGPVDASRLPPLRAALDGIAAGRIPWSFGRLAVWPRGAAVIEPLAVPVAAQALHAALADVLRAQGLIPEARRWRPHLTLARHARAAAPPAMASPLAWTAAGFELVQSAGGYRRLARWALR
jgi:RNA 2',3'-cyclic 3'-phosphodiesterase